MGHRFELPDANDSEPIETSMMISAAERTLAVHSCRGQFACWTGRARIGKTTTRRWLAGKLNGMHEAGAKRSFRVAQYETGPIRAAPADQQHKAAIRSVYENVLRRRMDEATYRGDKGRMATITATALCDQDVQMVLVDEAGRLGATALEGLCHVLNEADDMRWPLTIVLIGMHELPMTIRMLPQVENRVRDIVLFRPYTPDEALAFLAALHAFFASLTPGTTACDEVLDFMLSPGVSEGTPGRMVDLVERAVALGRVRNMPLSFPLLRAAHMLKETDAENAARDSQQGFRGPVPSSNSLAEDQAALQPDAQSNPSQGSRPPDATERGMESSAPSSDGAADANTPESEKGAEGRRRRRRGRGREG